MFFFECYSYHTVRNVRTHCSPTRRSCDLTDILLAQRFAGAAGNGRREVDIEWEGVDALNPLRFALANALGEEIPEGLRADAGPYYQRIWAGSEEQTSELQSIPRDSYADLSLQKNTSKFQTISTPTY